MLKKILEEGRWRLTKYDKVRDDNDEGAYIYDAYEAACEELLKEEKISHGEYMCVSEIEKRNINFPIKVAPVYDYGLTGMAVHSTVYPDEAYTPYIACFSSCKDDTFLWEDCRIPE